MILQVRLDIAPDEVTAAKHVLDILCDGLGIAYREVPTAADADLAYAVREPVDLSTSAIWVKRNTDWTLVGKPGARGCTAFPTGLALADAFSLARRDLLQVSGDVARVRTDALALTGHVISGHAERMVAKNAFGVPRVSEAGAEWMARAVVSELIEALATSIAVRFPGFQDRIQRWPGGASAALLLTHDVDRPQRRPTSAYYRQRIARHVADRAPKAAVRAMAGWARTRAQFGPAMPPAEDPNFGFDHWRSLERGLGGRGCFYVAVRSSAERGAHPADVAYDASSPEMIAAMRKMIEAGWEIGLHASIHAATDPGRFAEEKARLEKTLGGYEVRGVRHHYWALNPANPDETWTRQRRAGFVYDSSLGSNDGPGFRRGLAWPLATGEGQVLQVPPTLMDGGIFYAKPTQAEGERAIRRHLREVFALGGAAVLDWHLEQSNPNRLSGAGPALEEALSLVRGRSDIWVATPSDVADWWFERTRRRKALVTTRERIRVRSVRQPVSPERSRKGATRTARRTSAK
ncbi:MAG: hypothetical protein ACI9W4_000901 [Rhodothermales bacterium]|jgi:hypothetical protein